MNRTRIIPVLLLQNKGLVKTVKFKNPSYIGDPINAVKIFNNKEVDELVLLDIDANKQKRKPDYALIRDIVSEAFMPIGYGGGVTSMEDARNLFNIGVEKVIINSALMDNESLVKELAAHYGSQSIIACVDVKSSLFGKPQPGFYSASKNSKTDVVTYCKHLESLGVGEIILQSVDRDGTYKGYDLDLIRQVSSAVAVPIVACGGASGKEDLKQAIASGASAAAAGSMFVYNGKHKAVLISYTNLND